MILQVIRWAFEGIDSVGTDVSPPNSVKSDGKAEQHTARANKKTPELQPGWAGVRALSECMKEAY